MRKLLFLCAALLSSATLLFANEDDINYLTFTAEEAGSTVKITKQGSPDTRDIKYSLDGEDWIDALNIEVSLQNVGDKVYYKGDNMGFSKDASNYYYFVMTGQIAASGSVMSLINSRTDNKVYTNFCFNRLFKSCKVLTKAPELPAMSVSTSGYAYMFDYCYALTEAPELPATTLSSKCYDYMFQNCTTLVKAPTVLPATEIQEYCYENMFDGCKALEKAPYIAADYKKDKVLPQHSLDRMFQGCTALKYVRVNITKLANNYSTDWLKDAGTGLFLYPESSTEPYSYNSKDAWPSGWKKGKFIEFSDKSTKLPQYWKYNSSSVSYQSTNVPTGANYYMIFDRSLSSQYYNTICLPFDLPTLVGTPLEGAVVAKFLGTTISGNEVQIDFAEVSFEGEDIMEAGVPYLIKTAEDIEAPVEFLNQAYKYETTAGATITDENGNMNFIGVIEPKKFTEEDKTALVLSADNELFYMTANVTIPSTRAYFKLTGSASLAPKFASINVNPAPTGIKNVKANGPAKKVMENGHFVIVRNGEKYNAMGQLEK